MYAKIIAAVIGIIMMVITVSGCYAVENKLEETEDKEPSYICTISECSSDDGMYETKYTFTNIGDDNAQFRNEVKDIQIYYQSEGCNTSCAMFTEDWSQAYLWVYSEEPIEYFE